MFLFVALDQRIFANIGAAIIIVMSFTVTDSCQICRNSFLFLEQIFLAETATIVCWCRDKRLVMAHSQQSKTKIMPVFYHPHPKDGEGNVFTGVCPFTPWGGGGGTPVPFSFPGLWFQDLSWGVSQFQVLCQVSGPRSFAGGTPVLAEGTPVPARGLGYPRPPPTSRTGLAHFQWIPLATSSARTNTTSISLFVTN